MTNLINPKDIGTKIFYALVFTPLIVIIEWLMSISWGVYAFFIFTSVLNVDYTSSLVGYLDSQIGNMWTGVLFTGMTLFHVVGILWPKLWLRIVPLIIDVGIVFMFSGALFINKPVALGGVTIFTYALVIIFGIIKALNVKYTIYTIRSGHDTE